MLQTLCRHRQKKRPPRLSAHTRTMTALVTPLAEVSSVSPTRLLHFGVLALNPASESQRFGSAPAAARCQCLPSRCGTRETRRNEVSSEGIVKVLRCSKLCHRSSTHSHFCASSTQKNQSFEPTGDTNLYDFTILGFLDSFIIGNINLLELLVLNIYHTQ